MKAKRKIVEIDEELCNGCGLCVPACAEGALQIVNGKARLVSESYCDGLGACLGECPQGAIKIIERKAEEFNEKAVGHHLKEKAKNIEEVSLPCCPSTSIQTFTPPGEQVDISVAHTYQKSALLHWPVQIKLVPPTASFLRGAHLLIAADCTPVAYPNFHRDFLKDSVILLGCPKLDDAYEYIRKFAEIFKVANIKSVTVLEMEVPCCSAFMTIVQKAMAIAKKEIPIKEVVISIRGEMLTDDLAFMRR